MNAKVSSGEVSDGNEECDFRHAFGEATLTINWQKTWLNCVLLLGKVELGGDEHRYFTEGISKQSVEGTAWLFLAACSKIQEERKKSRKKL